jgi:hypothetical protein
MERSTLLVVVVVSAAKGELFRETKDAIGRCPATTAGSSTHQERLEEPKQESAFVCCIVRPISSPRRLISGRQQQVGRPTAKVHDNDRVAAAVVVVVVVGEAGPLYRRGSNKQEKTRCGYGEKTRLNNNGFCANNNNVKLMLALFCL